MKKILMILVIMLSASIASADTGTLNWTAPTTNTDGSSLVDLTGFNVYSSPTTSGTYVKIGSVSAGVTTYIDTVSVQSNKSITKCYEVTAVNSVFIESVPSNITCKTFFGPTVTPNQPLGLTVK